MATGGNKNEINNNPSSFLLYSVGMMASIIR